MVARFDRQAFQFNKRSTVDQHIMEVRDGVTRNEGKLTVLYEGFAHGLEGLFLTLVQFD